MSFAYFGSIAFFMVTAESLHFLAFAWIIAICATTIPIKSIWPNHSGESLIYATSKTAKTESNPLKLATILSTGTFVALAIVIMSVLLWENSITDVSLVLLSISLFFIATTVWMRHATALTDLAPIAPLMLLSTIVMQAIWSGTLYEEFLISGIIDLGTVLPIPLYILVGMALAGSLLAFWRARCKKQISLFWVVVAVLLPTLTIAAIEIWWVPSAVIGAKSWAVFPTVAALQIAVLAVWIARWDGDNLPLASLYALAAFTLISFVLYLLLSSVALTIALAAMVLLAAAFDRHFNLLLLPIFVQIGVVAVGVRLVVYPGIYWAIDAPLYTMLFAFLGVIGLFSATWFLLKFRTRTAAIVATESAVWGLTSVLTVILIYRYLGDDFFSFWGMSLAATVWLISAGTQLYRLKSSSGLIRIARIILASIFALIGMLILIRGAVYSNPVNGGGEIIRRIFLIDTLLIGYGLPALLFAVIGWKFDHLPKELRGSLAGLSSAFTAAYIAMEIRRFWRGNDLAVPGMTDPELYSYTVAMLISATALLFFAFSRRSELLYRIAVIGVGITIAKVFLIDMSGLTGLIRVASFLGLGLAHDVSHFSI